MGANEADWWWWCFNSDEKVYPRDLSVVVLSQRMLNGLQNFCFLCVNDVLKGERERMVSTCGDGFYMRC